MSVDKEMNDSLLDESEVKPSIVGVSSSIYNPTSSQSSDSSQDKNEESLQ